MHDASFWRKYARMWIDAVDLGLQLGINFDDRPLKVESESFEHFEKELSLLSDSKRDAVQSVLRKQAIPELQAFRSVSRSRENRSSFKTHGI